MVISRRVTEPDSAEAASVTRIGARVHDVTGISSLVLLLAIAAASFAQGAFYVSAQVLIAALVAVALLLAVAARAVPLADLRGPFGLSGALLAAWSLIRAAQAGTSGTGLAWALFGAGTIAVVVVSRRLSADSRAMLVGGLLAVGVAVAISGWLGVAMHLRPWGLPSQGLWRAASTLTYTNATAGLLVPLALVTIARLTATPKSVYFSLAATCLLMAVGATLSRAGVAVLAVGLLVVCWLLGLRAVARAVAGPALGAAVILLGLVPSLPGGSAPARPLYAAAGLAIGLVLAVLVQRATGWRIALPLVSAAAATAVLGILVGSSVRHAVHALTRARFTVASPGRSGEAGAALRLIWTHPLAGAGPGHAVLRWTSAAGAVSVDRYAHNEYLQVLTDLGIVGGVLVALLLVGAGRLLWKARLSADRSLWAGAVAASIAFAVHSGFDFLWQVPVLPLSIAAIVGAAICSPPARRHESPRLPSEEVRS